MQVISAKIRRFFEYNFFGVCTRLGNKLGMSTVAIRLFFIYVSFLAQGSPILLYLALAFVMNIRKYLRMRRSSLYEA